jgi:hypothetical protein
MAALEIVALFLAWIGVIVLTIVLLVCEPGPNPYLEGGRMCIAASAAIATGVTAKSVNNWANDKRPSEPDEVLS